MRIILVAGNIAYRTTTPIRQQDEYIYDQFPDQ